MSRQPPDMARPANLRRANTASVMQSVITGGPLSRAEIAARLGLSQGTVSKIIAPIVEAGVLVEHAAQPGGSGRPRVPVDVDPAARLAVGLHLGMQRTTVGLTDLRGRTRSVTVRRRRPSNPDALVAQAVGLVGDVVGTAAGSTVLGVGATTGGWVDEVSGTVLHNEALGWRDVPLRRMLEESLELPVLVESSVRAQASAELWFGCAQQVSSTVQIFVGNVIDAAVCVDRTVHTGQRSAAGSIGHLPVTDDDASCACGRRGVLQAVAVDSAVVAAARDQGLLGAEDDLTVLAAKAQKGNKPADALLRVRARHVGAAVGLVVEILDPDLVVLGGGVLAVPEHIEEVRAAAAEHAGPGWDPGQVVASALGKNLLVTSSAAVVLGAYVADPLRFESFG